MDHSVEILFINVVGATLDTQVQRKSDRCCRCWLSSVLRTKTFKIWEYVYLFVCSLLLKFFK